MNIAKVRAEKGISQKELAERSGIDQPRISRYETGEVVPNFSTALKLAEALGVNISELAESE